MAAPRRWAAELLHFWFCHMRPGQWFGRDDICDARLRRRFGRELGILRNRPARDFLRDPNTARAAVLLFDQLPRNLHRDSAAAFASDPLARAICKGALSRGWDRNLGKHERPFLYMPLMHSEAIADQRLSLRLFTQLGDISITRFARAHYRMVARFGRFPHRNGVLGRRSTAAELRAIAAGNHW
ncbi:MAG: DUF924 family protein [Novosphingobium sp.]